jgi:hypothetical protein
VGRVGFDHPEYIILTPTVLPFCSLEEKSKMNPILVMLHFWLSFVSDATVSGGNRVGSFRRGDLALNRRDFGKSW